jgi:hypothetical protein
MEYKILSIRRGTEWSNSYGTFQSYSLSLEGFGEPVGLNKKVPVADEPQVGDVLFGNIETRRNKTGSEYHSFKAEKRPDTVATPATSSWSELPDKQDSIHRSVALNDAAVVFQGTGENASVVLFYAEEFYQWLKGTQPLEDPFPKDEENHDE